MPPGQEYREDEIGGHAPLTKCAIMGLLGRLSLPDGDSSVPATVEKQR